MLALYNERITSLLEECMPGAELQSTRDELVLALSKSRHEAMEKMAKDDLLFDLEDDNDSIMADINDLFKSNNRAECALLRKSKQSSDCGIENLSCSANAAKRQRETTTTKSLSRLTQ